MNRHDDQSRVTGGQDTDPGALVYTGDTPARPVSVTVVNYDGSRLDEQIRARPEDFQSLILRPTVTWIDVVGVPEHDELVELGRQAGIHPLTMEDITVPDQRPKMEEFGSYLAVIVRMLSVEGGGIASEQVSMVFGENYVITFREQPFHIFDKVREKLHNEQSALRSAGPDFLVYMLLDAIVSVYLAILDQVDDRVEDLQGEVLAFADPLALKRIYALKEDLVAIRRAVVPAREVLGSLASRESSLIRKETVPYFRDAYDRCIQAAEIAEFSRDTLAGVMDLHTSNQSNRLAEITKFLTIIATIFIPLSFIAGFYGMNFPNMPIVNSPFGFTSLLLLMIGIAAVMLLYFRTKRWI